MFQHSAPTLLAYGGTFVNMKEMNIENIVPIVFPFGIGGPKMNRKMKVSHEMCIQYYMRLFLPQFREGPTILVLKSHTQQAIIIQDWSDVMQVINQWRTTR